MKNLITLIAFLMTTSLGAQHFEVGLIAGASNYMGDLSNNSNALYLSETGASGGLFVRYNFNDWVALRLNGQYGWISGEDANADNDPVRFRNLSFRSNLYEAALMGEFNILGYQPYNNERMFSPYVFVGIAHTWFNPRAEYQDEWYDLQPLRTEGQGLPGREDEYGLSTFAIPFGIGAKYSINDMWNIGFEVGARKTFTDYLDDVSTTYVAFDELLAANGELSATLANRTGELEGIDVPTQVPTGTRRGDNTDSDWYFFAGFTISINFIDNGLVGSRWRLRRSSGCETD
jgi:opacity protein-like surface antigen